MTLSPASHARQDWLWMRLSERIAQRMGLVFPADRLGDLRRGVAAAASELGFDDADECAAWLLARPLARPQMDVLARHLTVGETYFFREPGTFDVLVNRVLPELIDARRGTMPRLRLWSAGCCSGEEAYSLAIAVREMLPDFSEWSVTILGTDINPAFLRKAAAGVYGDWSFRSAPAGFKERYFTRTSDGRYAILPEIRRMVAFEHLNLVDDPYPSLATETNAMDVVFCRNVLMYFSPAQTRKVIGKLDRTLVEGGWLAVSPSEASRALFPQFEVRNFPGVILFRKRAADAVAPERVRSRSIETRRGISAPRVAPPHHRVRSSPARPAPPPSAGAPLGRARALHMEGRYADAADLLIAAAAGEVPNSETFSLLVRSLANAGRLSEARSWCDRWTAAHKMEASAHYVRGMVLLESGDQEEARRALQRALYLEPAMVVAHFALATLARSRGRTAEAEKHVGNTLDLLARMVPDDPLPDSDGLTAARLKETLTTVSARRRSS